MITKFSELLKKGYSLHRRLLRTQIVISNNGELELWGKIEKDTPNFNISFEGNYYTLITSDSEHVNDVISCYERCKEKS